MDKSVSFVLEKSDGDWWSRVKRKVKTYNNAGFTISGKVSKIIWVDVEVANVFG